MNGLSADEIRAHCPSCPFCGSESPRLGAQRPGLQIEWQCRSEQCKALWVMHIVRSPAGTVPLPIAFDRTW